MTLSEKIIARAAGRTSVRAGEIVTCAVDLAMVHDSSGPRRLASRLDLLGAHIWDPDKVVIITDHFVPAVDEASAHILDFSRRWGARMGVTNYHDMQGICHVVLPERGYLKPGMFAVGGDSHSPTGGAYGCFMVGIGATEMTGVFVTGEIWIRVPETILIRLEGRLAPTVSAKDVMLHLCARLGMSNDYKVIEFAGLALSALDMNERMVLTNMTAELGAKTGLIAPDHKTIEAILAAGGTVEPGALRWQGDGDARMAGQVTVDASHLAPQVAAPDSPENAANVEDYPNIPVGQAYIGACTGAKLSDLRMAAQILKGRKVAAGVRLLVAPASLRTTEAATLDGTLATLLGAGAVLLPSGCGACAGFGAGILAEGEVCISSTARNFKGRMGHRTSKVYLASPYTVAASAVAGRIADPREFVNA